MKILIFTPTFNNYDTCNQLIKKIRNLYTNDILVFDDGSRIKFRLEYNLNNITIIRNKTNMGKGNAIIQGFDYANKYKYSHMITIDSDMQHDPIYLKDFINADIKYDIVYGKRNFYKNMPFLRVISNYITSKIISFVSKCNVHDSQCGYRRYNLSLLRYLKLKEKGYQLESEILLKSKLNNNNIHYINISTIYNSSKSYISNTLDTLIFLKLIVNNYLIRNAK